MGRKNPLTGVASVRAKDASRGSNLEDVRRGNLSAVLSLVHRSPGITRAEAARETGLNRSTVAAIVADLERRGLVVESDPEGPRSIGRPSFIISPAASVLAVTVNPELDAVTIGLVTLGGHVLRTIRFENSHLPSPREVVNAVAAILSGMAPELTERHRTIGIGVAVPGLVRASDGVVAVAPHLKWIDAPFAQMIEEATGFPTFASNDATCGVIAESIFGAARGSRNVVYLNGGASGIGGGVFLDGALLSGEGGYAGELGHTLVNSDGVRCHCGSVGCLETEVTRQALLDALGLTAASGDLLHDTLVQRMAESDDEALRAVVERELRFLGVALRNAVNAFNPEVVVLGGFLGTLAAISGDTLVDAIRTSALRGPRDDVRVVSAALGADTLTIGAAELAFGRLLSDPTIVSGPTGGEPHLSPLGEVG